MNFKEFLSKYRAEIFIFLIALAARLLLFSINLNANGGDFISTIQAADGYYEISHNLILGNGYSDDSAPTYKPNSLRPPVWIYLIALIAGTFGSYVPVFIFEIILASLIPVLVIYLGRFIVSRKVAILAGIFLAIEPYTLLNSFWLASETFFTFLLLVFSIFIFKYIGQQSVRNAIWAGLILGLAILVKPTVQFLPFLVPIAFLFILWKKTSRAHLAHALCFIAVCALTIAPWAYRNYREFGAWSLTSQAPFNLYTVLVPTVLSIENGTKYESEHSLVTFPDGMKEITPANGKYFTEKALSIIADHKVAMLQSVAISIITFFTHDGILTVLNYAYVPIPNLLDKPALTILLTDPLQLVRHIVTYMTTPGLLVLLGRLVWIAVALLFFIGSVFYWKREKMSPYALYSLAIVAYFALVTTANGAGMNARFRFPVNAFILMFAFYGLSVTRRYMTEKWFRQHA